MLADLSVEHANTLEQYRLAHGISQSAAQGQASTEDLRQAMIKYRALFSELLGSATAPDGGTAARDGAAPDGAAPDGDLAGQPAETRTASGTGSAAGTSAMDADPAEARTAGGTGPASEVSAPSADPAEADPAAGPGTAEVPIDEPGPVPAQRRRS
jgi:hypothetical protein